MIRARLARLILRLIGPELSAEIKRVAEAEANHAGAVAFTIAGNQARAQDAAVLGIVEEIFDNQINALSGRADALPGDTKPAREDAAFEVVPPSKLN